MYPKGPDRALDVLQRKAPQILERRLHAPGNGITDVARNQDTACRPFAFQPCRHVDAVAIEVVAVHDQVPQVQPDAEHESSVHGSAGIGLDHSLLKLDGGSQRINCTGELEQRAVASELDQPAAFLAKIGSRRSARFCFTRATVPLSSRPIRREYPTTSAATIAARRRCSRATRPSPVIDIGS